ncbi:MAG TPA: hypothetical protein VLR46_00255 [Candidatus Dormibacteraeota bacterium]|nr:hypothetical protein [Candidatus Dormibacteraeota bacterium]
MRREGILLRAVARWGVVAISLGGAATVSVAQTVTTYAASGASQTVQTATYVGTSSLAGAGTGSFAVGANDATRGGGDSATLPAKASKDGTTPNPSGLKVTTSGNFKGFDGLNHADQRLAGTGIYTNTQFSLEPPDQGLCVGSGFVLESVNTAFRVFSSAGTALTLPEAYNQFFNLVPEFNRKTGAVGDFLSDPKCNYDVATRRWFMTILQADPPGLCLNGPFNSVVPCGRAHTLVAVSQSADPRGSWNLFSIDATDDGLNGTPNHNTSTISCPCFGDQPLLGMNADALFISTNEYGTASATNTNPGNPEFGSQIYAVSKWGIEHATGGSLTKVVHIFAGSLPMPSGDCCVPWDSIQPATSPTAGQQTSGYEYFLSSFTNNTTTNHAINTWVVTGTRSLGSSHPDLDIQRVQLRSEAYVDDLPISSPGFGGIAVDQKIGPNPLGQSIPASAGGPDPLGQINANDVRMNQVVYADGKLWSGVNTALQSTAGGPARSGIAYFVVQPSFGDGELKAEMVNQGYVTVKGNSTLFPSIGVNADGTGAIAFSVVGPDYFPSAAYVRINSDGELRGSIVIAGAGTAPDDGFTQYPQETGSPATVGRWGDYSAAVATPDGTIWMAAEYIPNRPRTLLANWGTFVYHISAGGNDNNNNT